MILFETAHITPRHRKQNTASPYTAGVKHSALQGAVTKNARGHMNIELEIIVVIST